MSKIIVRIASFIAILGIIGWILARRFDWFEQEQPVPVKTSTVQEASNTALPVTATRITRRSLTDNLSVTGTIEPDESVDISSEIAGKVEKIHFAEGKPVRKDDLLLKIVDDDLQAQLNKTQYQYELALQKEQRRQRLLDKGGLSQEEYDESLTELNTLKAEIERLNVEIAKTEIHAPFDGVIGFRYVSVGSYLNPGSQIANLVKVNPVKIAFSIPEKFSTNVERGQKITFTVEGINQTFTGTIYAKDPSIDPATRTQLMKAKASNSQGSLLPGAFARIDVPLSEFDNTLVVPSEAIIPELGKQKVFVYRNGKAVPIEIKVGLRQAENVQVLEGLQEGDTVITSGMLQLRPNMEIEIEEIQAI